MKRIDGDSVEVIGEIKLEFKWAGHKERFLKKMGIPEDGASHFLEQDETLLSGKNGNKKRMTREQSM